MYELTLESKEGYKLEFNKIGAKYRITDMEGLSPADATINTNENALIDGSTFNSSKVNARVMSIGFSIEGDAEESRLEAYRVLRTKEYVKMTYKSERLDVFIEGYVQSFRVNHTDAKQTGTVTILCPFPYFRRAQEVINDLRTVEAMFKFQFHGTGPKKLPYKINRGGITRSGLTIRWDAAGRVTFSGTYTGSGQSVSYYSQDTTIYYAGIYHFSGGGIPKYIAKLGNDPNHSVEVDENGGDIVLESSTGTRLFLSLELEAGVAYEGLSICPTITYEPLGSTVESPIVFGEIVSLPNIFITNEGAIETGLTFVIYARRECSGLKIFNYDTGEYLGLNFSFRAGDTVIVKTGQGEKTIELIRNGVSSNIFNSFDRNGTWLQLPPGGATFVYAVEQGRTGDMTIEVDHFVLYEGV